MDSNSNQTDEKLQVKPAQRVTFCQRNKSGDGSFASKLRDHFHEFIHASVDEHRRCLRNTIQKVIFSTMDVYTSINPLIMMLTRATYYILFEQIFNASKGFGENSESINEDENSVQLHSSTKN